MIVVIHAINSCRCRQTKSATLQRFKFGNRKGNKEWLRIAPDRDGGKQKRDQERIKRKLAQAHEGVEKDLFLAKRPLFPGQKTTSRPMAAQHVKDNSDGESD